MTLTDEELSKFADFLDMHAAEFHGAKEAAKVVASIVRQGHFVRRRDYRFIDTFNLKGIWPFTSIYIEIFWPSFLVGIQIQKLLKRNWITDPIPAGYSLVLFLGPVSFSFCLGKKSKVRETR